MYMYICNHHSVLFLCIRMFFLFTKIGNTVEINVKIPDGKRSIRHNQGTRWRVNAISLHDLIFVERISILGEL